MSKKTDAGGIVIQKKHVIIIACCAGSDCGGSCNRHELGQPVRS